MLGYYQRWEREGEAWKEILDSIQQTIDDQARNIQGAEVARERWDAPEITLRWYTDDNMGRAIQVLIVDANPPGSYELHISASAWKDSESPPVRIWKTEDIETIPVSPVPQQFDLCQLKSSLCKVYDTVCKWAENDLGNKVALPPLPPNLTGKFVKGRYAP